MIQGMDVSHWNGKGDFSKAKAQGVEFVYIRLGSIDNIEGKCYLDDLVDYNVAEAKRVELPFGFYFYTRPKFSAQVQGSFIISNLAIRAKAKLPLAIDAEESGAYVSSTTQFLKDLHIVITNVGYQDSIYTRQSFWDLNVDPDPLWSTMKLWAARYNSTLTGPWSDGKYVFRDWNNWKFWQWSETGNAVLYGFPGAPVGSAGLDMDYYNGNHAQFTSEFNIQSPELERIEALENALSVMKGQYDTKLADMDAQFASIKKMQDQIGKLLLGE